jgi:hypothetical protein
MDIFMKEVNFYIPSKKIFHTTACIAQGFIELGFKVRSNVRFSLENIDSRGISTPFSFMTPPLFHEINEATGGLYIIDVSHGFGSNEELIHYISKKNVFLINMADSANFQDFPSELKVATAHYNKYAMREGKLYPMPFGLSADIVRLASSFNLVTNRYPKVIQNFKPSLSQGVRNFLAISFERKLDHLKMMSYEFKQEQGYAESLANTMFICAYGGEIYRDLNKANLYGDNSFAGNRLYEFKQLNREYVVLRWDSWRFYEASVFGCIPIQLDFKEYGFEFYAPADQQDFIAINLSAIDEAVESVLSLSKAPTQAQDFSRQISQRSILRFAPRSLAQYALRILEE